MSRWLLAALLSISGCAFALDGPDPDRPRNRVPQCDTSKGLVALDGAMAATMGVVTLSLVSEPEPAVALLPLAIGALYLGGAVSGNKSVNKCRVAMDEFANGYPRERFADRDDDERDDEADEDDEPRRRLQPRLPPPQQQPAPPQQQTMPAQHMPQQQMPAQPLPAQPMPAQMPQQPPPAQQPPAKAPGTGRRSPATDDDDWTDFWREVP